MIARFRRKLAPAVTPVVLAALLASCFPSPAAETPEPATAGVTATPPSTPLPTRSPFPPGTIIDYAAQNGDTLPAVAAHFNTTVEEILAQNPELPSGATTLPPGFVLHVPAYYVSLTGNPLHIIADSDVVNGPTAVDFDIQAEVEGRPGFLANLSDYAFRRMRPAWQVVEVVARNYSIHPRLLLTLLEHQTQALTKPFPEEDERIYPLGYRNTRFRGLYRQLIWAAEQINDGYYGWRAGTLAEIELADGRVVRPDPWWNAGTTALHYLFASMYGQSEYEEAVGQDGFYATYVLLWGGSEALAADIIPANLQQPELTLPFQPNKVWDFTAGPHYSWGTSLPLGALDFAPPAAQGGCVESDVWVTAPAAGMIVRSGEAAVVLDLDGDGDERTGWVIFFFHVAEFERIGQGVTVDAGALLGHPSCEGGQATGTHVHIARRYNGEWIPAAGALPFVMDGWVASYGANPYEGTLTRGSSIVPACTCSSAENRILYEFP